MMNLKNLKEVTNYSDGSSTSVEYDMNGNVVSVSITSANGSNNGDNATGSQSNGAQSGGGQTNYAGPTVIQNYGSSDVWLKPENNNAAPVLLKAGQKTSMAIDGVTHPNYPGQVFKVTNLGNTFGVHVNNNGVFLMGWEWVH